VPTLLISNDELQTIPNSSNASLELIDIVPESSKRDALYDNEQMELLRSRDLENTKKLQKLYEISKISEKSFNRQSLSIGSSQFKLTRANPYENGSF